MSAFTAYVILAVCLLNLARLGIYLISSDIYTIRQSRLAKKRLHLPTISVVIPAYNEASSIVRALESLYYSNYPYGKYEIIVVNDGSTDATKQIIQDYQRSHKDRAKIRLINRPNGGKAAALNYALRRSVRTSLVMCLDADSFVHPEAIRNAVQYFRDRNTVALCSNVNIVEDGSMLALAQRIEYLMGHHMKKGQDLLGVNYIIGGVGSVFRKSALQSVNYYDTNTMTEDIDLTMKLIITKHRKQRLVYGADVVTYTEAVHTIRALITQRFRWKYGRSQTFFKNSQLFFSRQSNHRKRVSWGMLPYVLFQDFIFLFEPVLVYLVLFLAIQHGNISALASGIVFFVAFTIVNTWSSDHLSLKTKLRLSYYAPPMYLLIYLTSVADYAALVKSLILLPVIRKSLIKRHVTWRSPKRAAAITA